MPINIEFDEGSNALKVIAHGKLSREDYDEWAPKFTDMLAHHGKLNVLMEMRDFEGWDAGGLWEDIKFDVKHYDDVNRIALVGDKTWQKFMAPVCKPFTSAEVRHFPTSQLGEAEEWIGCTSPPAQEPA